MAASIAAAALSASPAAAQTGQLSAAEPGAAAPREAQMAMARERMVDLLVSERIDRIDYQAETYEDAMRLVNATIDAIFIPNISDYDGDLMRLADHAGQIVNSFNETKPRGTALTFAPETKRLAIRNPTEARLLGEIIGNTLSLINDQFDSETLSYKDRSRGIFRSVVPDTEEGPYLNQYVDGIAIIASLPRDKRARYFQ
jgi:hypothetical protein